MILLQLGQDITFDSKMSIVDFWVKNSVFFFFVFFLSNFKMKTLI